MLKKYKVNQRSKFSHESQNSAYRWGNEGTYDQTKSTVLINSLEHAYSMGIMWTFISQQFVKL